MANVQARFYIAAGKDGACLHANKERLPKQKKNQNRELELEAGTGEPNRTGFHIHRQSDGVRLRCGCTNQEEAGGRSTGASASQQEVVPGSRIPLRPWLAAFPCKSFLHFHSTFSQKKNKQIIQDKNTGIFVAFL